MLDDIVISDDKRLKELYSVILQILWLLSEQDSQFGEIHKTLMDKIIAQSSNIKNAISLIMDGSVFSVEESHPIPNLTQNSQDFDADDENSDSEIQDFSRAVLKKINKNGIEKVLDLLKNGQNHEILEFGLRKIHQNLNQLDANLGETVLCLLRDSDLVTPEMTFLAKNICHRFLGQNLSKNYCKALLDVISAIENPEASFHLVQLLNLMVNSKWRSSQVPISAASFPVSCFSKNSKQ